MAEKQVVAEDERDRLAADEIAAEEKRLGQAVRFGLHGVLERQAQGRAVAQQGPEARGVRRRGDHQDPPDAGEHQDRQRVIDHRFVINRKELLAEGQGQRVEPGARAAGEDYAFHRNLKCAPMISLN